MTKKDKTTDAVRILHGRYINEDPERLASIEAERVNAQVAALIRDLRTDAGLTQGQLAGLVGTTQSVISRLEDGDYEGHSLSMLNRIAKALNHSLKVHAVPPAPVKEDDVSYAFHVFLRQLRRSKGLTVDKLAAALDLERSEVVAMERDCSYRPSPMTLHRISRLYGIPERRLAALAGALREVPAEFQERASRFAAQSDSFAKLSADERRALDEFMAFLRTEPR
jgi:transcriptional regulator with XRE-family HTH domain